MTLRMLQVFVKVAECGKINTAAKQLYVSQSSVSQSISEIEREYGIVLFDRIGKQLFITPIGRELLEHARKAIAYQESIHAWLSQCSSIKRLRVGATVTVGATVFSSMLVKLKERCPNIEIFAYVGNTDTIAEKLLCSELDIALVEGKITSQYISSRVLMDDHLVLACGKNHRFFGKKSVSINELNNETLLLREHGSGTRAQIVEKLNEYAVHYKDAWESSSSQALKRGVIDGHGISIISERLVSDEAEAGSIWTCTIEEFPIYRHFSLAVYRNRVETEAMRLFAGIVEDFAANESAG